MNKLSVLDQIVKHRLPNEAGLTAEVARTSIAGDPSELLNQFSAAASKQNPASEISQTSTSERVSPPTYSRPTSVLAQLRSQVSQDHQEEEVEETPREQVVVREVGASIPAGLFGGNFVVNP